MIAEKLTPVTTGIREVDEFFKELDRRIESDTSPHPQESKDRLRWMRSLLVTEVEKRPEKFAQAMAATYEKFGVTTEFFANQKRESWT